MLAKALGARYTRSKFHLPALRPLSVDMTKSKVYNSMKSDVKKSISRSGNFAFKTGPGEYAEHDRFLGVTNPDIRKIAKEYQDDATLDDIQALLESEFNEERFLGLVILVHKYEVAARAAKKGKTDASPHTCEGIYNMYMANLRHVNNWNLVDLSAYLIAGPYLENRSKDVLMTLVGSTDLWERRVAIVTTFHFIRNGDLDWTFKLSKILLGDSHDLIHKASGWMLREAGKRDVDALRRFLDEHAAVMPRTMLRYSIEKLGNAERKKYLGLKDA